MNNAIDSLASTTFAGKRFNRKQLVEIQQTVHECRHLSLRELGHTLCEHLNWVTPGGKHRIQSCLNALKEMQTAGLLQLPQKQTRPKKATQKPLPTSPVVHGQTRFEAVWSVNRYGEGYAEGESVSVRNATIVNSPPHWGQTNGQISLILAISIAQR